MKQKSEKENDQFDLRFRLNSIMGYMKQMDPIKYKNQTTTSKALNVDRSNLSAALNGDERYLSKTSKLIKTIFKKFPEINRLWYEDGIEDMLKNNAEVKSNKDQFYTFGIEEKLNFLYEQNKDLMEENKNLNRLVVDIAHSLRNIFQKDLE